MNAHDLEAGAELLDTRNDQRMVLIDVPTGGPLFRIPSEESPFDRCQLQHEEFEEIIGDELVHLK